MKRSDRGADDLRLYAKYSQLGLEMVGPLIVGLGIDYGLGTMPWLTILGAVAGLVHGIWRLNKLVEADLRRDRRSTPQSPDAP